MSTCMFQPRPRRRYRSSDSDASSSSEGGDKDEEEKTPPPPPPPPGSWLPNDRFGSDHVALVVVFDVDDRLMPAVHAA